MEISTKRRCIFCMEELIDGSEKCPLCGKSPWEYQWQNKFLPPGTMLKDKYTIGVALGNGGYGITYIAFDTVLQQRVAVKEFFPDKICSRNEDLTIDINDNDTEAFTTGKSKFKDEAALIFGSYDVPGICSIKDYFEENNTAYIVEEFLPGGTLDDALKAKKSYDSEELLKVFLPVLRGLNRIHSMGIIHMDISPDNLMFDAEGQLKLIDFGAAKQLTSANEEMALKQAYAPPEQYNETELIGPWTDIYSLCAVMYQALTGTRPEQSLKRIKKDSLKPAADISSVDFKLSTVLSQGLSLDIRKRFFSCSGILEKLDASTDTDNALTGKIRHLWGERWLNVVTEQVGNFEKSKEKKVTKHKIKKALKGCLAFILVCAILTGTAFMYIKIAPESYFDFKLNMAIKKVAKEEPFTIKKDSKLHKEVLAVAEKPDWADSSYNITKANVEKLGLVSNSYNLSYLDKTTFLRILEHYMEVPLTPAYDSGEFYGFITEKDNAENCLSITSHITERYVWDTDIYNKIEVSYDLVSKRVMSITITADEEICQNILKNVFPYLIPETYLTDDEIKQIIDDTVSGNLDGIMSHPKFYLSGFLSGSSEDPKCYISIYRGDYF